MTERQEPTISTLGSSDDGLDTDNARCARATETRRRPPQVSSRQSNRPVARSSGLAWFAFLLSLLALGCVGALYYQTQAQLKTQQSDFEKAIERVAVLEGRLSLADDESTQSMVVLQTKVKENASEVKKLWGVAYDRNRKTIEESKVAIAKLKKSVTAADKKGRAADESLKNTLDGFKGEVNVLNELMNTQQAVIQKLSDRRNSEAAVTELQGKLDTLQTQIDKRLRSNEEAIEAIDTFRLQVNRDLLQLKGG